MVGGGGGKSSAPAAPQYGSGKPGVAYIAPASASPEAMANRYSAQYTPQTATPFLQSIMAQHSGQNQQNSNLGLPSLQSMFNMPQKNLPLQGGIQQLTPMTPYAGSMYRPNMSAINQNLNNVAPSVALQQQRAAEEQARLDALNPTTSSYDNGSQLAG
jgi:hypothetical protein